MVTAIKGIYRDENSTITPLLKELLDELELENEGIIEILMDLTLNHNEQREKTYNELLENPVNFYQIIDLRCRQDELTAIIENLKNILYDGYEEIPIVKSRAKPMSNNECLIWLGTKVKPLILEGVTSQKEIGEKLNVPANTISQRVTRVYDNLWNEYVEFVKQGIY